MQQRGGKAKGGGERRLGWGARLALFALALLLLSALLCLLLRSSIASSVIASGLRERGMDCGDLSVELSMTLSAAEIGPMRCTLAEGEIEEIVVRSTIEAQLSGLRPTSLRMGAVEIRLRDRRDPGGAVRWLGAAQDVARDKVVGMVRGLRELARREPPPTRASVVTVRRGQRVVATVRELGIGRRAAGLSLEIGSVELARQEGLVGSTSVQLVGVTGEASDPEVHLRGTAVSEARVLLLGSVGERRSPFSLHALELGGPSPSFEIQADL